MTLAMRSFGILHPVFSLPGSGSFDEAASFVEFLAASGARIWQVLPMGPTHEDLSPYLSLSSCAGNPQFIGLRLLSEQSGEPIADLATAFARTGRQDADADDYQAFVHRHHDWLPDFALFCALRSEQDGVPWYQWPLALRHRDPAALDEARQRLADAIRYHYWQQFVFFQQWGAIRDLCNAAGVQVFGDVPIYVSHDSVDVWQHQKVFRLNPDGSTSVVAGVPPDYFSPTGQRWGNPLYDWDRLKADGYRWWIDRMRQQAALYDIVRIDHFRGLESYWQIPATSETAEEGAWRPGPGHHFLSALMSQVEGLTLVAEDLGTITHEVDALRRAFQLPGIRVLQFGFDGVWDNPHSPANVEENMVLYTGTHDNDTCVSWYHGLVGWQRELVDRQLQPFGSAFPESLIACAFANQARTVIIPMADLLGLGPEGRINTPGTMGGNWQWQPGPWPEGAMAQRLRTLGAEHHRN